MEAVNLLCLNRLLTRKIQLYHCAMRQPIITIYQPIIYHLRTTMVIRMRFGWEMIGRGSDDTFLEYSYAFLGSRQK